MNSDLNLCLGVKADPIEYRYSYEWLFDLMREEGVTNLQLGTFFELYQLPDDYILDLRDRALDKGIAITSIFTAHRELGGFLTGVPALERVARRNYERLIEIGGLLGVQSVGSNPGAILRDEMERKAAGIDCYLRHMKELMHFAHERGVPWLAMEPMSCLAEPPTLPDEIRSMADTLDAHHTKHPDTARVGYCADVSHGYADESGTIRHTNLELLEATFPYLSEVHLKNTDDKFSSTFGFTQPDRERGIVDLEEVKTLLHNHADEIPQQTLHLYFEISGPKLGRDYSDLTLEQDLRASLRHIRSIFEREGAKTV